MTVKKPGRPRDEGLQARRQEEILDAAARLFAVRGFPNADVQELADRLGVGKGTIYRYFPSKDALFLAAVDRGVQRLHAEIRASVANVADPLAVIRQAIATYLAFFDAHPELVELFIQERAEFKGRKKPAYFEQREATTGEWHDLLRGLVAAGRLRDVPVEHLGDVISDLLFGTIVTNSLAGRRAAPAAQARHIVDILFHGILTDPERGQHVN